MLGDKLKVYRKSKGYTQSEVANAIGVSRASYTKYELNMHLPDSEQLKQISNLFGVSVDKLLGTAKPSAERTAEDKLVSVYQRLSDESKTQLMSVAYLLLSDDLKRQGIDIEQQLHKNF